MRLPNTEPNPALNPARQAGLTVDEIANQQTITKKNNEMIAKFNDNLANITSLGQNFQMGVYGAFGNNFVTRSAMSIPSMLTDFLDTMLEDQSAEKKNDPLKAALEDILKELNEIDEHISTAFGDSIKNAFRDVMSEMDSKNKRSTDSDDCCEKNAEILSGVLDRLDSVFGDSAQNESSMRNSPNADQILSAIDTLNRRDDQTNRQKPPGGNDMVVYQQPEFKDINSFDRLPSPNKVVDSSGGNDMVVYEPEATKPKKGTLASSIKQDSVVDVEPKKQKSPLIRVFDVPNLNNKKKRTLPIADAINTMGDDKSDGMIKKIIDLLTKTTVKKETPSVVDVNIVGKAFDKLIGIESAMVSMMRDIPISSQETLLEQESTERKRLIDSRSLSSRKDSDITDVQEKPATESKKESDIQPAPESEKKSLLDTVLDTAGTIAEVAGVAKGAGALIGKAGKAFGKLGKAGKGTGIGGLASIGLDFAADAVGTNTKTGASLDVLSDVTGMASTGALIGSVVPGVGTAAGAAVGGLVGGATSLYKNWDTLFESPKSQKISQMPTQKSATLEESTSELDRMQKDVENKKNSIDGNNTVISNSIKNTNVFPARQTTKNDDLSFNRYLDKSFS